MMVNTSDITFYNHLEIKPHIGAIVLVLTLMVLGIVGNIHVLFVFKFRMKKATSHRIFILCLATLDLLSNLVSMPFITADMFLRLTFDAPVACRIFRFFLYFFAGSSGFLLLPIAIDRYLKTCKPFGQQIDPRRAKLLCSVVLMFSLFSFWPIPILYGRSTVVTSNLNISGVSCYLDDAFKGTSYLAYWNTLMLIVGVCLGLSLVILYCMIGKSIMKHVKVKNKLLNKEAEIKKGVEPRPTFTHGKFHRSFCKRSDVGKGNKAKQAVLKVYTIKSIFDANESFPSQTNHEIEIGEGSSIENSSDIMSNINILISTDINKDSQNKTTNSVYRYEGETQNRADDVNVEKRVTQTVDEAIDRDVDSKNHKTKVLTNLAQSETSGNSLFNNRRTQKCLETSRKQRELLQHLRRSKRTTQMFFALTILYFITFIPHLILQVITFYTDNFVSNLSYVWQTLYHMVLHCSFFDTMFRNELKKMYSRTCCKNA